MSQIKIDAGDREICVEGNDGQDLSYVANVAYELWEKTAQPEREPVGFVAEKSDD